MLNAESKRFSLKLPISLTKIPIFRNMLSSAHILAMDTKNLLDVVDSIRVRYPHIAYSAIFQELSKSELPQNTQHKLQPAEMQHQHAGTSQEQSECYENVGKQMFASSNHELMTGIYDNECVLQQNQSVKYHSQINQQSKDEPLKIVEETSEFYSNTALKAPIISDLASTNDQVSNNCTNVVQNNFETTNSQKLMTN